MRMAKSNLRGLEREGVEDWSPLFDLYESQGFNVLKKGPIDSMHNQVKSIRFQSEQCLN